MRKKNGGFTLIELLIAIAVLSTMAGVLLQGFVLSRKINTKARQEELVQDAARKTMEELKGFSFEELDERERLKEENKSEAGGRSNSSGEDGLTEKDTISIGKTVYQYETLSSDADDEGTKASQGFLLKTEYRPDPEVSGGKAKYLIYAEADWGTYGEEPETENVDGTKKEKAADVYSINQYQMPNIADVSSFQNIVVAPATFQKDDELMIAQLLEKVNPDEDEAEEGSGTDTQSDGGAEAQAEGEEQEPEYQPDAVTRYLDVTVTEDSGGSDGDASGGESNNGGNRLSVNTKIIYTIENPTDEGTSGGTANPGGVEDLEPDFTLITNLTSAKKKVVKDEKTGQTMNRIYLFLPDKNQSVGEKNGFFEKVFVTYKTDHSYEFYVAVPSPESSLTRDVYLIMNGGEAEDSEGGLQLYTNLKASVLEESGSSDKLVSLHEADKRLYRLVVTVYEADYGDHGELEEPIPGKEVFRLDSTKPE